MTTVSMRKQDQIEVGITEMKSRMEGRVTVVHCQGLVVARLQVPVSSSESLASNNRVETSKIDPVRGLTTTCTPTLRVT